MARVRNSKDFEALKKKTKTIQQETEFVKENISRVDKRKAIREQQKLKSKEAGFLKNNTQVNPHDYTSEKTVDGAQLEPNILHKFATYNVLFTLSGLREEELQDHSFLTNTVHDVVARSGGIGGREGANVSASPFSSTGGQGAVDAILRREAKQ